MFTVNDAGTPDSTGGVVSGALVNVAVHDLSRSISTLPLAHSAAFGPLQPANVEPAVGVADTATNWPTMYEPARVALFRDFLVERVRPLLQPRGR